MSPPLFFSKALLALTSAVCAHTACADPVSISGTVVAAGSSAPINGARVSLFQWGINSFPLLATTTTGADGSYQLDGIEAFPGFPLYVHADGGDYWVVQGWPGADCPPVPLFCGAVGSQVPIVAGQVSSGIDFALKPGGVIQGQVTRTDTGLPVAGAFVAPFYYVGTDADGLFRLRSVTPGQYKIFIDADFIDGDGLIKTFNDGQQCDDFLDCDDIAAQPFDVAPAATTQIDFALEPGVSISGKAFVDGDPDAPRPGVFLYNESDPQRARLTGSSVGFPALPHDYVFKNLIARNYSVRFGDPADVRYLSEYYNDIGCAQDPCDLAGVTKFETTPGQQITNIDATVSPRQKITGRVVDALSQIPLAGAEVQAVAVESQIWFGPVWKIIAKTYSDASGNFTLVGIPSGTALALRVNALDHLGLQTPDLICDDINAFCGSTGVYPPPLNVSPDTALDVGDIALSQGTMLSGLVTNLTTGQGLPDAQVTLFLNDAVAISYTTGSDGTFSTQMLRPAEFKAVASSLHESQMYDHLPCPALHACDLSLATPISSGGNPVLSGIDFSLHDPDIVFSSGFDL